jgi:sulfur carrier protein ThiS
MTHLTKKLEKNEVMELNDLLKKLKKNTSYVIESSNGKIISIDTKDPKLLKFAKEKGLT